ncbi:putative glutathione transferase [Helianthus annuus]|nr:putative glutathione transferase [Helianthus annuus]KAJ0590860.1 putative glutathione transferase [Helianthus annuus]KAJ0762819.1 putative glutathione transferase [Helianthus annuus]KAJ0928738.1 putative glutathione transferase [Helianthus annuus]
MAYWLGTLEEATEIKFVTKDKFPRITEWADNFLKVEVVKDVLPPRVIPPKAQVLAFFKQKFGDS